MNPIDVLDLCIKDLMQRKPAITFVQVGAHDGVTLDPIYPYVKKHGWRGIAVEPQPAMFKKLAEAYNGFTGVRLENSLISNADGEMELFVFADGSNLPYHATMLASLNREALVHNGHGYKGNVVGFKCPCLCPSSLLKKHMIEKIDLLQIDTEGHDRVIIVEFLKSGFLPALIHFESALCGIPEELNEFGYRVTNMGIDSIAYRQGETGSFDERKPMNWLL